MKKRINEIKRMQKLAGIIKENQNEDNDPSAIIEKEYKSSPNEAPYNKVLDIIKSFEDDKVLEDFKKEFQNKKTISKKEYEDFVEPFNEGDGYIFNQQNWVSIFDYTIYDRANLIN